MNNFDPTPVVIVREDEGLEQLASQINAAHALGVESTLKGLTYFKQVGAMLTCAKERCGHGKWLSWVTKNLKLTARQAQKYMRLYRKWDHVKYESDSHLEGALRLLIEDSPEEKDLPEAVGVPIPTSTKPNANYDNDGAESDPDDNPDPEPTRTHPTSVVNRPDPQEMPGPRYHAPYTPVNPQDDGVARGDDPKPVKIDWKNTETLFGGIVRGVDAIAKQLDAMKSTEYEGLQRALTEFFTLWKQWRQKHGKHKASVQ